jgi:hypothetical protein
MEIVVMLSIRKDRGLNTNRLRESTGREAPEICTLTTAKSEHLKSPVKNKP